MSAVVQDTAAAPALHTKLQEDQCSSRLVHMLRDADERNSWQIPSSLCCCISAMTDKRAQRTLLLIVSL
jgi:hypothetical protein